MIELTNCQLSAASKIKDWFTNPKNQIFTLSGYAGTGKTFLVKYVVFDLLKLDEDDVCFVAPTGKATSVMIQRGLLNASTIHRLIYNTVEKEVETEIDGKKIISKKLSFVKKEKLDYKYKLIVVDEVSMVDEDILTDLVSFGIPLLCCGDDKQLPACFKSNKLLEHPDAILDEIVRQSEDSMIVRIATMARLGKPIPYGNFGDVIVVNRDALSEKTFDKLLITSDQILCGLNSTRKEINKRVKKLLGFPENQLSKGEKVICHTNNWSIFLDSDKKYNLVNGTMGTVSEITKIDKDNGVGMFNFIPDFLSENTPDILFDSKYFETGEFSFDMHQRAYILKNGNFKLKKRIEGKQKNESDDEYKDRLISEILDIRSSIKEEQVVQFSEGYCISVHKSQGSEYNNVVVIDESHRFAEPNKHLYTAITRAKSKIVIIK